jgi:hypothetical protein
MEAPTNEIKYHEKYNACSYTFGGSDIEVKKIVSKYKHEDWTLDEILEEAMGKGFNIVVKNGKKGRWYLKRCGNPLFEIIRKIKASKTKPSYKNRTLHFINYLS